MPERSSWIGVIRKFDTDTGHNVVEVDGRTLVDLPVAVRPVPLTYHVDDQVIVSLWCDQLTGRNVLGIIGVAAW